MKLACTHRLIYAVAAYVIAVFCEEWLDGINGPQVLAIAVYFGYRYRVG